MKFIGFPSGVIAVICALLTSAENSVSLGDDYDILQSLKNQFDLNSTDVDEFIEDGADGYAAFRINPKWQTTAPALTVLPATLPRQFYITTVLKPDTGKGFLFAVLDPTEMIIQLGVELVPAGPDITNITLLYTNASAHSSSQTIATFATLDLAQRWSRLFLNVENDEVSLYINCSKVDSVRLARDPAELVLNEGSVLRVGQAGPHVNESYQL